MEGVIIIYRVEIYGGDRVQARCSFFFSPRTEDDGLGSTATLRG